MNPSCFSSTPLQAFSWHLLSSPPLVMVQYLQPSRSLHRSMQAAVLFTGLHSSSESMSPPTRIELSA